MYCLTSPGLQTRGRAWGHSATACGVCACSLGVGPMIKSILSHLWLPKQTNLQYYSIDTLFHTVSSSRVTLPKGRTYFLFSKSLEKKLSPKILFKPIIKLAYEISAAFKINVTLNVLLLMIMVLSLGAGVGWLSGPFGVPFSELVFLLGSWMAGI